MVWACVEAATQTTMEEADGDGGKGVNDALAMSSGRLRRRVGEPKEGVRHIGEVEVVRQSGGGSATEKWWRVRHGNQRRQQRRCGGKRSRE